MGKAPKLLTILVHPSLIDCEGIQELKDKGHWVTSTLHHPEMDILADPWDFDLILGPTSWRMDKVLIKYLPQAVKEARTIRYPGKGKTHGSDADRETE